MTNKIGEYNSETQEMVLRDMTSEEIAKQIADLQEENNRLAKIEEAKLAETIARENRISAYQKLGLTEVEIAALVPPLPLEPAPAP